MGSKKSIAHGACEAAQAPLRNRRRATCQNQVQVKNTSARIVELRKLSESCSSPGVDMVGEAVGILDGVAVAGVPDGGADGVRVSSPLFFDGGQLGPDALAIKPWPRSRTPSSSGAAIASSPRSHTIRVTIMCSIKSRAQRFLATRVLHPITQGTP